MFRFATIGVVIYAVICICLIDSRLAGASGRRDDDDAVARKQAPVPPTDRQRERLSRELVRAERKAGHTIQPRGGVPLNDVEGCTSSDFVQRGSCLYPNTEGFGLSNSYTWVCSDGMGVGCTSSMTLLVYCDGVEGAYWWSDETITCGCMDGDGPCSGNFDLTQVSKWATGTYEVYVKVYPVPYEFVTPGVTPTVLAWTFTFVVGDDGVPIGTMCGGCPSPCKNTH